MSHFNITAADAATARLIAGVFVLTFSYVYNRTVAKGDEASFRAFHDALPPTFRLGDQDRTKYAAIGESDRMTLKFVKP